MTAPIPITFKPDQSEFVYLAAHFPNTHFPWFKDFGIGLLSLSCLMTGIGFLAKDLQHNPRYAKASITFLLSIGFLSLLTLLTVGVMTQKHKLSPDNSDLLAVNQAEPEKGQVYSSESEALAAARMKNKERAGAMKVRLSQIASGASYHEEAQAKWGTSEANVLNDVLKKRYGLSVVTSGHIVILDGITNVMGALKNGVTYTTREHQTMNCGVMLQNVAYNSFQQPTNANLTQVYCMSPSGVSSEIKPL